MQILTLKQRSMEETKQEINDAEIVSESEENQEVEKQEEQIETEVERAQRKRREAMFEYALFLILGILIGITLKTEAVKRITIGFNDYQIKKNASSYDVNAIKKGLDDQAAAAQAAAQAQQKAVPSQQNIQVK